jgi:hypothetical protein
MATTSIAALQTRCPLCGSPVLSFGRGGRIEREELHPVQLGPDFGRSYTLCDDCGILAGLPADLTLN